MALYDIGKPGFMQPHRLFTSIFMRELKEQLEKGAGPSEALQQAQSVALHETLNSTREFPELFFEETELAGDEPGEGQEDEEIEFVQSQSQDEEQADPAIEEDVLPLGPLGNFKQWMKNWKSGYSNQKSQPDYSSSESEEEEEGKTVPSKPRTPMAKKKKTDPQVRTAFTIDSDDYFSFDEDDESSSAARDVPGSVSPLLVQRSSQEGMGPPFTSTPRGGQASLLVDEPMDISPPSKDHLDVSGLKEVIEDMSESDSSDDDDDFTDYQVHHSERPWEKSSILQNISIADNSLVGEEEEEEESDDDDVVRISTLRKSTKRSAKKRTSACLDDDYSPTGSDSESSGSGKKKKTPKPRRVQKPKKKAAKKAAKKRRESSPKKSNPLLPSLPEPAQPDPAQPDPAQPEPAQPEPAQPEPAQPVVQVPAQPEPEAAQLIRVELEPLDCFLAPNFSFIKFNNDNKKWCWHNACQSLAVRGLHMVFTKYGETFNDIPQSLLIEAYDVDLLILELAKLKSQCLVDAAPVIHGFCYKYKAFVGQDENGQNLYDYPRILYDFQSPEGEFFTKMLMGSILNEYLQPVVEVTIERTPCNDTNQPEDIHKSTTEPLAYIKLSRLPQISLISDETFTELIEETTRAVTEKFKCRDCGKLITKTTTTSYVKAPELLVLFVNRTIVLPPLPGREKEGTRLGRNDQEINLIANDEVILPMSDGSQEKYGMVGSLQHVGSANSGHIVTHLRYPGQPGYFLLVNDLDKDYAATWSHLSDDEYSAPRSYLFLYMKQTATPSVSILPQIATTSQQPESSDEDRLVPTAEIEKQLNSKEDHQGKKVILRNQKPTDPQYENMWYIFLDRVDWRRQWFAIPLIGVIKTLREANCTFKKPPPKKPRSKWNFEQFFREVFHTQPGKE